ncbi:MAG TPA: helix-turn-helix domain-containing protein, partial [Candidatus Nitrosotenuis sp.]|nr:helix-turn-helix domain-containing protein [Candidatus Nitrosotenuis sp.]
MPRPFDLSEALFLIEDQLAALLRLSCTERALYYHLLRHTHAKGACELRISRRALAGSFGVCVNTIYLNVRKLIHKGCARLIDRRLDGLVLEVRAPQQILDGASLRRRVNLQDLESADFFRIDRL